ncbi:MAG TPA: haloacid dehalogenase type II [Actinomycetota bacterium]
MAGALVFDVNETLLDLRALDPAFERAFGDPGARAEWFARLLHGSLVATVTGVYEDFGSIAARALDAVTARRRRTLPAEARDEILGSVARLPPHPEVPGALSRLRSAGFPMAALTNSAERTARAQLEHAGLIDLFDEVLSVEAVGRYKPAPEPYLMASERLGRSPEGVRLVTAHDWDVWGAVRAGCRAAFVARADLPFVIGEPPDVVGPDLDAVAEAILRVDEPSR